MPVKNQLMKSKHRVEIQFREKDPSSDTNNNITNKKNGRHVAKKHKPEFLKSNPFAAARRKQRRICVFSRECLPFFILVLLFVFSREAYFSRIVISTRLFLLRPSSVALVAIGSSAPRPFVKMWYLSFTPILTR